MKLDLWMREARENNFNKLMIVKDLEDGEEFPVYFIKSQEAEKYAKNIISESKLKIIAVVNVE